jgi:hypothetical protein
MVSGQLAVLPIVLVDTLPNPFPKPKFEMGQYVVWANTSTQDHGYVIGLVYSSAAIHQVTGYHYAVKLHPGSPSSSDIQADWAFEEDLALLAPLPEHHRQLLNEGG